MYKHICRAALAVLVLLGLLAGCAGEPPQTDSGDPEKLNIIATIFPAYDFARIVAGDRAEVTMLITPGAEMHSFTPTPADLVAIGKCDLLVCVGGESEEWVYEVLDSIEADVPLLVLSDGLELLATLEDHDHEEQEGDHDDHDDHDHGWYDEQVWTSLKNAQLMVGALAERLAALDSGGAELFRQNAADYTEQLAALDLRYADMAAGAARTDAVFATQFPFRYLFNDYGLTPHAASYACGASSDPSAAVVAELIDYVNQNDIPVVFCLTSDRGDAGAIIAEETGAELLRLDAAHSCEPAQSYLGVMEQNLELLERALY